MRGSPVRGRTVRSQASGGECPDRIGEAVGGFQEVGQLDGDGAGCARFDFGGAGFHAGVLRGFDAGSSPGEQADEAVGGAADVGDDVASGPRGDEGGAGEVGVGEGFDGGDEAAGGRLDRCQPVHALVRHEPVSFESMILVRLNPRAVAAAMAVGRKDIRLPLDGVRRSAAVIG
ncbi:hypothetical protein NSERKGN1266_52490 [Nocardia seriolae]|nr:hypothetical protein NSERKGN1266_52490 [Nocardia seriolae]